MAGDTQENPLSVRRPVQVLDPSFDVRGRVRAARTDIKDVNLEVADVVTIREKSDALTVR